MAAGDLQQRNPMDSVQSILNIFKGSSTTNTSSETVSNDKANAYIKSILESTNGLSAVASGQKAAGMYGSTVNQQLTNDLLARTSAQTAALSSQKTSTQKVNPQLNLMGTLGTAALGQVLTPVVKAGSKKLGLDKLGDNLADSIFGSSSSDAGAVAGFPMNAVTAPFPIGGVSKDFSTNINDIGNLSNTPETNMSTAGSGADFGTMVGAGAATAGIGSALASGGAAAATDASYVAGVEGIGSWAAGSTAAAGAAEGAATAAGAAEGAGLLDTLGTAAAAVWIICTELNRQGRLPYRYYIYGAREFAKYDERGKQGYYIWAIPSVRHLRKHPNSRYSKLMELVFNARAEYLAAKAGCKGARKTTLGFLTTHGLYAFCWTLSRTIARKSYTKEQILNVRA